MILNPRGARKGPAQDAGMEEDFRYVAALRTDGQGPPDRPQGQPLQHQDQAALPAEPVQRDLHLGHAGAQRSAARLHQRDQERRPQWRPRCVPDQGQGRQPLAARAGTEARDREEDGGGCTSEAGELTSFSVGESGASCV
jgi:hypothetical protein